ncbi:unnamed protein product [Didymodactylos carnosus]|uniref:Transmembrane protein n=1 Tax=Didymodactylos carnosus TaxID=1234261 RepID=A0A8S2HLS1_9BILA|nr:unnamed protein product [Didymodactylos carnosus]CAF3664771.1 unnamed protein product [Didymodactylos carnosus]
MSILTKEKIQKLNLFQSYASSTNENHGYYEILSTRLYLITLTLSVIIIALYTSLIDRTQLVTIKSPITSDQYTTLYQQHSQTLTCPCTTISITYEKFIHLSPTYHQICSSQFISDDWYQYITESMSNIYYFENDDFRNRASAFFQMLQVLCQSTNETIQDSLVVFNSTQLVNDKLIPQQLFQIQAESYINLFIETTTNTYKRSLQIIRDTTQSSALVAYGSSVTYLSAYQSVQITPNILYNDSNEPCSCRNTAGCIQQAKLYDYLSPFTMSVTGIYFSCYVLESVLRSTLECFYNQACFIELNLLINPDDPSNFSILNSTQPSSQYQPTTVIQEIINNLMTEQWNFNVSFESYYQQCQPSECHYTYIEKFDYLYTITTILGLIGGLSTILSKLIPFLIIIVNPHIFPFFRKLYKKYKQRQNQIKPTTITSTIVENYNNINVIDEQLATNSVSKKQSTTTISKWKKYLIHSITCLIIIVLILASTIVFAMKQGTSTSMRTAQSTMMMTTTGTVRVTTTKKSSDTTTITATTSSML